MSSEYFIDLNIYCLNFDTGDNVWDLDEYRFGAVLWCYVTNLKEIDEAFGSMLNVSTVVSIRRISF